MSVQITRRTKTVTLLQGEDDERLQELRVKASELRQRAEKLRKAPRSALLADETDPALDAEFAASEAEREADEFAAEAEARGVEITLRALGRRRWPELLEAHPPREGNDADKRSGANLKTLPDVLVPESIVEPQMSPGEKTDFLDGLSFGQWDYLALEAWNLNTQAGADPKARLGSETTRT